MIRGGLVATRGVILGETGVVWFGIPSRANADCLTGRA